MDMGDGPVQEFTPVCCRPARSWWALVVLLGFAACGMYALLAWAIRTNPPAQPSDWVVVAVCLLLVVALLVLPAILVAVYQRRAQVTADGEGLRWCMLGRTRVARWDDVTDFYDRTITSSDKSTTTTLLVVETSVGRLTLTPSQWTRLPELRASIARHATAAKTDTWGEWRWRSVDWPFVFTYDTRANRRAPGLLVEWHALMLTAVVIYCAWRWIVAHTPPSLGLLLTPTGLFLIAKETVLLALHPLYVETRRRLEQRITLDADGLLFDDGDRQVRAGWDAITDFYIADFAGNRYAVETARDTFDFLLTLKDNDFLRATIVKFAHRAGRSAWERRTAKRPRIAGLYTYRTAGVSEALGSPAGLSFLYLLCVGLSAGLTVASGQALSRGEEAALAGALILIGGWIWASRYLWTASLRVDEAGITQKTPLGERTIVWEQVQDFYWTGNADLTFGHVVGPYGRIRFWRRIEDVTTLEAEIAARAIHSRSREWAQRRAIRAALRREEA